MLSSQKFLTAAASLSKRQLGKSAYLIISALVIHHCNLLLTALPMYLFRKNVKKLEQGFHSILWKYLTEHEAKNSFLSTESSVIFRVASCTAHRARRPLLTRQQTLSFTSTNLDGFFCTKTSSPLKVRRGYQSPVLNRFCVLKATVHIQCGWLNWQSSQHHLSSIPQTKENTQEKQICSWLCNRQQE